MKKAKTGEQSASGGVGDLIVNAETQSRYLNASRFSRYTEEFLELFHAGLSGGQYTVLLGSDMQQRRDLSQCSNGIRYKSKIPPDFWLTIAIGGKHDVIHHSPGATMRLHTSSLTFDRHMVTMQLSIPRRTDKTLLSVTSP